MDYIQCRLEKEGRVSVGYMPKWAAKVGNIIDIESTDEFQSFWDSGWKVIEVYPNTQHPEEFVKGHERDYKKFDYT